MTKVKRLIAQIWKTVNDNDDLTVDEVRTALRIVTEQLNEEFPE